jgi:hypothetical protein
MRCNSWVALVLMCYIPCAFAEDIDNPEYGYWKAFKAGSTVQYEMLIDSMGNKMTQHEKVTLVEISGDQAVIESATSIVLPTGQTVEQPATRRTIPARVTKMDEQPTTTQPSVSTEKGQESIEIAGKEMACETWTVKANVNGMDSMTKTWMCPTVPGHIVHFETVANGGQVKTIRTVKSFEAK